MVFGVCARCRHVEGAAVGCQGQGARIRNAGAATAGGAGVVGCRSIVRRGDAAGQAQRRARFSAHRREEMKSELFSAERINERSTNGCFGSGPGSPVVVAQEQRLRKSASRLTSSCSHSAALLPPHQLTQAHAQRKGVLQRLCGAVQAHAAAASQRLLIACRWARQQQPTSAAARAACSAAGSRLAGRRHTCEYLQSRQHGNSAAGRRGGDPVEAPHALPASQ